MTDDTDPQALREAYRLPAAYGLVAEGRSVLAWRSEAGVEAATRRVAADPEGIPRAPLAGRAPLGRLETEAGPVLVRPYRKGGLLRHVRGARFRGRLRPLDELVLHHDLLIGGIPVVDAVGCVVQRAGGRWRGWLLVREEAAAVDLEAWLYGAEAPDGSEPEAILRRAGAAVAALHGYGIEHADLHPKNLLLTVDGRVLVLDLDRARRHPAPLGRDLRLANLARFERALVKHRDRGMPVARWRPEALYAGYAGADGDAARWAADAAARRGGLVLRRLWWRLAARPRAEPTS